MTENLIQQMKEYIKASNVVFEMVKRASEKFEEVLEKAKYVINEKFKYEDYTVGMLIMFLDFQYLEDEGEENLKEIRRGTGGNHS